MDPATIAASVITILGPYVSQVGEALTKTVGEVAVDKASKLLLAGSDPRPNRSKRSPLMRPSGNPAGLRYSDEWI